MILTTYVKKKKKQLRFHLIDFLIDSFLIASIPDENMHGASIFFLLGCHLGLFLLKEAHLMVPYI